MKTKKILSVLLVALMAFAFSGFTAFAAGASITVKSKATEGTDNTKYTYYQLMKANISDNGSKVAYYVENEEQANALTATGVLTATAVVGGNYWTIEVVEGKTDKEVTDALEAIDLTKFTASDEFKAGEKQDVDPGYYLVTSTLGTKVILRTLKPVEIDEKNAYPSLTKTVDKTSAAIGEVVTYTVTVTVPATVANKDIVVVDTIDEALTRAASAKVDGTDVNFDGDKITIPAATVVAKKGSTITITYTATLNEKATVNTELKNKVHLEYADFVGAEVETSVKTFGFSVKKLDSASVNSDSTVSDKEAAEALAGASFSLWTAAEGGDQIYVSLVDGVYRVDVSNNGDADAIVVGEATVEGLAEGTYYLQEDVAPDGYNKLDGRIAVVVNANSSEEGVDVFVENKAGVELPSTGAFGTTMFYVVGMLAILGAGVFMVTNKRIAKEEF